jgi:aspartate racemase
MRNVLTIGVLGGMGPQATNYLCSLITEMTPARTDQEHIPVIAYNNSAIPSRLDAVLRGGPSPVPELVATARKLETAGADFIIMPCNTAHFFIEDVVAALGIPVLDMIELTVQHIRGAMPEVQQVGILASTATIESKLYLHPFMKTDINLLTPLPSHQRTVMEAIYGERGIKAGFVEEQLPALNMVAEALTDCGADVILAGCTEISLAFSKQQNQFTLIDPLRVIAQTAVERALVHGKHLVHSG